MTEVAPKLRNYARCLIVYEATDPARDKLPRHLEVLIGKAGVQALLSRAHALAIVELPWLSTARVNGDGSLEAEGRLQSQLLPEQLFEGQVVLMAQMLGLLETFIGENLTMRLLREMAPDLRLGDLDFGEGAANEKAK